MLVTPLSLAADLEYLQSSKWGISTPVKYAYALVTGKLKKRGQMHF
jgi:hypothetical protein